MMLSGEMNITFFVKHAKATDNSEIICERNAIDC